jgi:uncharacterized protein HemY
MPISQCLAFLSILGTTWRQSAALGAAAALRAIGNGVVTTHVGTEVIAISWIVLILAFLLLLCLRGVVRISRAYILSLERRDRSTARTISGEDERDYEMDSLTLSL